MPPRVRPFGPLSNTRYAVNGVAFDMVRVPPGRFVDGEGWDKRALLVSRLFELGVTLVTQALWRAVTGMSPSHFRGDDLPVEQASWEGARLWDQSLAPTLVAHGPDAPEEKQQHAQIGQH